MGRLRDQDRLYDVLADLHDRVGGYRYLAQCDRAAGWPERGVYFFFEPGEYRHDGYQLRVTRVGTHALTPSSKSTLWGRLRQHRGMKAGSRAGGGDHRGSIFRLHVGSALLATAPFPEENRLTWHLQKVDRAVRAAEHPVEVAVSQHIGSMPFLWVAVDDPPGPSSDRGFIERHAIGLLSRVAGENPDLPSDGWLGRHAKNQAVGASGLWNVNHVDHHYDPQFLDVLAHYVERM